MDEAYLIHYEFIWSKQRRIAFPIRLDPATIAFLPRGGGQSAGMGPPRLPSV